MNYYELKFELKDAEEFHQDLLIGELAEIGFDTFEESEKGFNAFVAETAYNAKLIADTLATYKDMFTFSYESVFIPQKNWNEVWESNFEPLEIKDQVYVRATFHEPKQAFPYEIVIDPKMAFGTGHHQTTTLMMEWLLETEVEGKNVLDMGCGTAILGILASKQGAKAVDAIDYDDVCYLSAKENAELNDINNVSVFCGSKEAIPNTAYDIILANINRNILLDQIERYAEVLKSDGLLFLSGFYESDIEILVDEAKKYKLQYVSHKKLNDWVAVKLRK
ncbi:(LSU ribosomal protein L11P)-lysine N-methyltransferase [Pseudopedobacter saltans DSM 12145]|uniref:Ribosomal protein L11 methyltransferase n=1 Tax=Pseudopedobacter saltans (strain ATCC 51119 / DSM 12145 / JCM 21818 / CCUG 39354 / LMG 10337 / NBRC 100064 / NCIMB 13643) TaxID=762903 RepID=F0SEN0_PSESL|nr:50S ribosomal protein L11 methyltransferase [Pseudopedobacter saltans]ADY51920.1 (LSU ribosomal protein L11P)-lysine N-methyltransferase [Pseudopedobacter saltans DSM 12145]